jgi:phosphoribosylformylglycinamidine synthase
MKAAVVVFPGSNCDADCLYALSRAGFETQFVWHKETNLAHMDLVVLPGGFSYGDYLRTGAIARFSPIMKEVKRFAEKGGNVLGICNGFQILLEAGLLPGAMLRNRDLQFICRHIFLKVENNETRFTSEYQKNEVISLPIAHGEGNYFAEPDVLAELEDEGRIVFRYSTEAGKITDEANSNGSQKNIASIINKKGNVLGMMPHPERASEGLLGSEGGKRIWQSLLEGVVI